MSGSKLQSYSFTPKTSGILYETIPDRLKYFAESTPDKVACVFLYPGEGRKQITYREIYTKCVLFAKGLRHLSIKEGDIIGLGILNDPEWIITTFGCQMVGAIPLHFMFQRKDGSDVLKILKIVGNCVAIVCDPGYENSNIGILKKNLTIHSDGVVSCEAIPSLKYLISTVSYEDDKTPLTVDDIIDLGKLNETCSIDLCMLKPDDIASMVLSSGSTGEPKVIPHSHYSLLLMGFHFKTVLNLMDKDVYYNDRTFNWIGGYPHEMLYCGSTRVTVHSLSGFKTFKEINSFICDAIDSEDVTSALMITPSLQDMVVGGIPKCKGLPLKTVGTGGGPVTSNITSCVGKVCETLVVIYGSTEIGFVSAKPLKARENYEDYNVGKPLPGVELKIIADDKEQVVPPGETGEIYIRHPVIFLGYVNEQEKTKKVYTPSGWYKSDDIGHMTEGMEFFACGRKSDTVIIANQKISVSYVESIMKSHPMIYDALVCPIKSTETFQQICAAVVKKPDCDLSADEIKQYFSNQYTTEGKGTIFICTAIIPKYILFFDSFPKTFNGKVYRKGVSNMVHERLGKE